MASEIKQKVCPGCLSKRIIRFSKTSQKWLWETHYLVWKEGQKKQACPYSNTDRNVD